MKTFNKASGLLSLIIVLLFSQMPWGHAQKIDKDIDAFNKLIVSPKINVTLVKGEKEHVALEAYGVNMDEINVEVRGKTLKVYLDKAKVHEKMVKVRNRDRWHRKAKISVYEGVKVNAIITYRSLKHLEIRGKQDVICDDPLRAEKFRVKLYGESKVRLASLKTERLKASLFGENDLLIKSGSTREQVLKSFGENKINTRSVNSQYAKANTYGESKVYVNTSELFKVTAFGESKIYYAGGATLHPVLILGENSINRIQ